MSRRSVLRGMLASAAGLGLGSIANANEGASGLIQHDINVQEALDLSQNRIILHCGRGFNEDALQSIKYAIEEIGMFEVDVYGGGPPDMVTSYINGHNFPGRHYAAGNAQSMVEELRDLAAMHEMALEAEIAP